jgi:hypothetical protein
MTQQHINLGTPPNGADGDTNRTAWGKTEANFNELFARPVAVGKNLIINGNFDVWQRGASIASSSATAYLADRWVTTAIGSSRAVSQQRFAPGQVAVPGNPTFFHRVVVNSAAGSGNACNMVQNIESCTTLAGQTATLTFYAKADAARPMAIEFYQQFGSGGSPSPINVGIGVTKVNLTTAWQKFVITVEVPSLAEKTLGTAHDGALAAAFWFDAGSSFNTRTNGLGQQSGTFDIAKVQLEVGAVSTAIDPRPIALELALCKRYFEKFYPVHQSAAAFNAADLMWGLQWTVTKRVAPAISTAGSPSWVGNGVSGQLNNILLQNVTESGCTCDSTSFTGTVTQGLGYGVRGVTYLIDAEY